MPSADASTALALLIFAAALLYSSVGHGGASGYLAALALFGVAPDVMKPTALVLNVLVAAVTSARFARAGWFSWRLFWPFASMSVPFAFLGGAITAPPTLYKTLIGAILLFAAVRLLQGAARAPDAVVAPPRYRLALACGSGIGLVSGLTGVGGGIFLSPLLVLRRWADTRTTAGVSAAFIWVNSLAGLAGHLARGGRVPLPLATWALAALAGGILGSQIGSRRLPPLALRRLLALVLAIAGAKMLLT